jgi:hypothetical protein
VHVAFAVTFGIFLVLMAVLVAFVVRFAVREGRRGRREAQARMTAPTSPEGRRPVAAGEGAATGQRPEDEEELDEAPAAALVDDPDERGDG